MAKKTKSRKLTDKHKQFCREYIIDFNATRAYKKVYNCSVKVAGANGHRLLKNAEIQKTLTHLITKRSIRTETKADDVMIECRRIALADVGEAFNPDGSLKKIKDIPIELRRAISGFEVEEIWAGKGKSKKVIGELKKVKFWSKDKNIEVLFKHLGLFEKDNKQKTTLKLEFSDHERKMLSKMASDLLGDKYGQSNS